MTDFVAESVAIIQERAPGFKPKLAMELGSGQTRLSDKLTNTIVIPFTDLPGFPQPSVKGHSGQLICGYLETVPVICLSGRRHLYEATTPEVGMQPIKTVIRTLKECGIESFMITNASGSLRDSVLPGEVVVITDHINFQFTNPLVGEGDSTYGSRFVGMEEAHDPELRKILHTAAQEEKITLHEGVYIGVLGPTFETPAEIRAFRTLGADVVGMSTVPQIILARHCGLRVVVLSAISNLGAGMSSENLSHEVTLNGVKLAEDKMVRLISHFAASFKEKEACQL